MATSRVPAPASARRYLGIGAASVCLGVGGLAFAFMAPFGVLLAVAGLVCGLLGLVLAWPGRQSGFGWSIGGTLLSLCALVGNLGVTNYAAIRQWLSGFFS